MSILTIIAVAVAFYVGCWRQAYSPTGGSSKLRNRPKRGPLNTRLSLRLSRPGRIRQRQPKPIRGRKHEGTTDIIQRTYGQCDPGQPENADAEADKMARLWADDRDGENTEDFYTRGYRETSGSHRFEVSLRPTRRQAVGSGGVGRLQVRRFLFSGRFFSWARRETLLSGMRQKP